MRVALIINQRSRAHVPGDVERRLEGLGVDVAVVPIHLAGEALQLTVDRIVVAGGDGSIGCAADIAARRALPLAVIPTGTANDFARVAGVPLDIDDACRVAAQGRRTWPIDLAFMGDLPFLNVAAAGLSGPASVAARSLKRQLGPAAYVIGGITAGITSDPFPCSVEADGELVHRGDAWQVMVANTGAFGGGSRVGEAHPRSALLDVVVVADMSRARLAELAINLRRGALADQEGVLHAAAAKIAVDVPEGMVFVVDGEQLEPVERPVHFSVVPRAVQLLVA